jgi:hypothetical protein
MWSQCAAEEDIARDRLAVRTADQRESELTDAGAGIEDDQVTVVAAHFDTRGVATVPDSSRAR